MSYRQLLPNNRHPGWLAPVLFPLLRGGRAAFVTRPIAILQQLASMLLVPSSSDDLASRLASLQQINMEIFHVDTVS
jgi:hypothetical protein